MAEIFISYSSYDREKAIELAEGLRKSGYDIWIDQGGIGGAQNWSSEIVEALNKARTVLFLISKDSVTSHNCAKEIHLANEKHKNILPVVLEETPIPVLFEYPLAGLQRVPYERTQAIMRALDALKSGKTVLEAMLTQSIIDDGSISLAVLPFEDHSPTQDNEWLANGIVDELIDTLGSLSGMKVNPRGDVIYYKKDRPKLDAIALDLKVRYLVEGSVQKLGERIRIKVTLTDILEHKHIWHEKYDGTFEDIFGFQDKTCYAISDAIKLKLSVSDKQKIEKKSTENADAYELWLRGNYYFHRRTSGDYMTALELYAAASVQDPNFASAHLQFANTCLEFYRMHSRDNKWIIKADQHIKEAEILLGESASIYWIRSNLSRSTGNYEDALTLAEHAVKLDPNYAVAYDSLGFALESLGKYKEAADARERYVELWNDQLTAHFNYLVVLNEAGDISRLKKAAQNALPIFARHIRLSPDDLYNRVNYASILAWADQHTEALQEANYLLSKNELEAGALYNLACLFIDESETQKAMQVLQKAIDRGFSNIEAIKRDPDLDPLRRIPEFEQLINELEIKLELGTIQSDI